MENIALAFSGGGFRAACFSLGSLSYLNHLKYGKEGKPLLQHVTFISSTSGGSITNLAYSAAIFKGLRFEEFYPAMLSRLEGEQLLDAATRALSGQTDWKGRDDKSRNLINAFSLVYDRWLEGETLGLFSDHSKQPHLQEICVNATEFTNGLPFRFQSQNLQSGVPNGKIGNRYIFIDNNDVSIFGKIKLSDILAASSCFPSGFEPIVFPNDFTYEGLSAENLRKALHYTANTFTLSQIERPVNLPSPHETMIAAEDQGALRSGDQPLNRAMKYGNPDILKDTQFSKELHVGMMDGGIDDNQAIDAFENAFQRRQRAGLPLFDLFIACDVTSNFLDGYTLPMRKKGLLNAVPVWGWLVLAVGLWLLMAAFLPYKLFIRTGNWSADTIRLAVISGLFDLPLLYLVWVSIKKLLARKGPSSSWKLMLRKYGPRFLFLKTGTIIQMLLSRIKSVFILAGDIYLKQIRRMYYHDIFDCDQRFKGMAIQNTIYDCSKIKFGKRPPTGPQPSASMIDMAETARLMGTTLWFDANNRRDDTMKKIVVTGQFTTCYNLLRYINKLPADQFTPELQALQTALLLDWEAFCKNADFLY